MYFKYNVTYFNTAKDDETSAEGLIYASNYSEAARKVVEDYGDEEVCDLYLRDLCIESECIDKEEIDWAFKAQ